MKRTGLISLLVTVSIAVVVIIFITLFITHGCDECKTGKSESHLVGPVVKKWVARYHGVGKDGSVYPSDMAVDSVGNVYILGEDSGNSLMLLKYRGDGKLLWVNSEEKFGSACNIAIDGSDNIYVNGYTFVAKYNAEGKQLWQSIYDEGWATDIGVDNNGNVYVASVSGDNNQQDLINPTEEDTKKAIVYSTVKYDPSGVELWRKNYSAIKRAFCDDAVWDPLALVVTSESHVCVTGCYVTFAYDQDGNELWAFPIEGIDIAADESGNVCVTGSSGTIMYDSKGKEIWSAKEKGSAVVIDSVGNVFTTGEDGTLKYTNNGQLLWTIRTIGEHIAPDDQGGTFVALNSGYENKNLWAAHYDGEGHVIWSAEYDGPASDYDYVQGLKVDEDDNVYIVGGSTYKDCPSGYFFSDGGSSYRESVLIKYSQK